MSEKRFSWKTEKLQHLDDEILIVVDNANKEWKGHILNIVDKLNELNDERMMYRTTIDKRIVELEEENEQLKSERRNDAKEFSALLKQNFGLKRRLDYEKRMHKRWKDDCLAILEEQDLNDYVEELQKSKKQKCKKSGWDSEPNTDYVTRVKEGLK